MAAALAVVAGALLLAWPALLNGYPLVFSDTGGFLHQTLGPLMLWDKPWVYGPLLHAFHWRATLWLPLAGQALLVSAMLWLVQRVLRGAPGHAGAATPGAHLAVCVVAATLTTAPFTVALLMPDVLTAPMVLALGLLGFARERLSGREAAWLVLVATLGIAAHLSHVPIGLALALLPLLALRVRGALLAGLPLVLGVALVVGTNAVGHGRAALSPHGATFLLARLQADGPAARVIQARCPDAGWYLCAFADRLPMDANDFLWEADSPVNRAPDGTPRFLGGAMLSPEAGVIVGETLRAEPIAVARAVLHNTVMQLLTAGIGDTLGPENLAAALHPRIAEGFPARETAAFEASLQMRGELRAAVAPLALLHALVLLATLPVLLAAGWRTWRAGDAVRVGLLAAVLVGVVGNAAATGGLSGVFPRYQARIAWLLPVVALLLLLLPQRPAGREAGA
ncbi:hypothetical protein [Roseomonas fluvialis]|uniref:Glycosyltransferase RgtA/B/C/D-like domain-containing protein n=1 Tax=Roseomonas fluvialis TaxID=1750527 RepID=A0ABN6P8H9_9PROT|nr:hypothetical protein [Roseomonas fluvialis]BDG74232.1 hypothetical protein Rmf_41610 [Roseomonas fluvialis]